MAQLLGFQITRLSDKEKPAEAKQAFTVPSPDDGTTTISAGGYFGQYLDMEVTAKDDIDLINDQSQQVFRNCIDKYSHNVHFIASCSNTQKVIDSIQSRCTIMKIKPMNSSFLQKIFINIKTKENLNISKKAESFILNVCNNSIRLLINYMEKFKLLGIHITEQKAKEICTNISFYEFENYTKAIFFEKRL